MKLKLKEITISLFVKPLSLQSETYCCEIILMKTTYPVSVGVVVVRNLKSFLAISMQPTLACLISTLRHPHSQRDSCTGFLIAYSSLDFVTYFLLEALLLRIILSKYLKM